MVALGGLTLPPDVLSHPTEDESVWTMPPALVQRSGTTRTDVERPLLREQRPLEMSRMAGKEQVRGTGGTGGTGVWRWEWEMHTGCTHTPWHTQMHTHTHLQTGTQGTVGDSLGSEEEAQE